MGIRYIILLLLILPIVNASSVRINEVMYDSDIEWVELYLDNYINLNGYKIQDLSSEDTLEEIKFVDSNYALIIEDGFDYSNIDASVYSVSGKIGSGLNNDEDLVIIKDSSDAIIDSLHYYSELGADGNEKSLCKIYNIWKECSATPGAENIENLVDYTIRINEFLPDPLGDDDSDMPNGEWVELYNLGDESLDLENLNLKDISGHEKIISDTNTLSGTIIEANNYLVVYMNGLLLNNDGYEKIGLYDGNFLIDSVSYSDSEINKSFSKIDGVWVKSVPTPNKENEPIVIIEQDFSKIEISELFPDPEGSDNNAMPNGEWVEMYNSGNSALDLEGLGLQDNLGSEPDIYISESNTFNTIIESNSYLIVYMNGRYGFLNNDGFERISLYKDNILIDDVSYSGSNEGLTWSKVNDKWVMSLPTPGSKNYGNESDITISRLDVDKIYDLGSDNKAKFGQIIKIRLLTYKGDTNKESIKFYIENEKGDRLSKESKVNVEDKFTNYTFTVPIQIIPNCKEKFEDGTYYIVIKGLDDTDKEEIEIEGITKNLCEAVKEYKEVIKEIYLSNESILKDSYVTGSVIYEGKSEKQGRYAVYGFSFSLIMLIVYLLWKNE